MILNWPPVVAAFQHSVRVSRLLIFGADMQILIEAVKWTEDIFFLYFANSKKAMAAVSILKLTSIWTFSTR